MPKRRIPERAKDCVSLADKIAFSLMVREKFETLREDPWAGPEQFSALMDEYSKIVPSLGRIQNGPATGRVLNGRSAR
jgi:hypothetical protein